MDKNFSLHLIKGKIAEVIFQQMFCEAGGYNVIPFGYENIIPELSQYKGESKGVADSIRHAPDFALISNNKKEVCLVEVKFRRKLNQSEIKEIAKKQSIKWNPLWIFVACLDGFYFGECSDIIKKGKIDSLSGYTIKYNLQKKYINLVKKFEF